MSERMIALIAAATFTIIAHAAPLHAYDGVVEKKAFTLQSYVTVRGAMSAFDPKRTSPLPVG